jgi:hypothetical protein
MISTFICQHCGRICQRNPRSKDQEYCSLKECQQARKNAWGKKEYHTNKAYRQKRLSAQKEWRARRPAHEYQKQYRASRPEYEKSNREQQIERNKKQQKGPGRKIVNTDALPLQSAIDGAYALMRVTKGGKIVNTDALMVQLQVLPEMKVFPSPNPG